VAAAASGVAAAALGVAAAASGVAAAALGVAALADGVAADTTVDSSMVHMRLKKIRQYYGRGKKWLIQSGVTFF